MKKILISGGSGLIGSRLTEKLVDKGYTVAVLSRSPTEVNGVKAYGWDIKRGTFDPDAFRGVHAIIHLAGAGIADSRWTEKRKKIIVDSRVQSANLLLKAVKEVKPPLEVFISASGINYYGSRTTDHVFMESDPPSNDFIGYCCVKWEEAAVQFNDIARVVMLRTGVVLSERGGALDRIAKPIKFGLGAPIGSGNQIMPYIHLEDLCDLYIASIEDSAMKGPYNAVNGDHITNKMLTQAIAKALKKPLWLPNVPAFALKAAFGEMSSILLQGSRASAQKVKDSGFIFRYPQIDSALEAIYK